MCWEEIVLEFFDGKGFIIVDICFLVVENNVVIEMKENKMVVYVEELNIFVVV